MSVADNQRSCRKLKLTLTYFRSTMDHERLNDLALMCIKREELEVTNWNEIVDHFVEAKVRKVRFK